MHIITRSVITCPECGFTKEEGMAVNSCLYFYECEQCHVLLKPKEKGSCVFCSYGSVRCPPAQQEGDCCV